MTQKNVDSASTGVMVKRVRSHRLSSLLRCAGSSLVGFAIELALLTLLVSGLHVNYLIAAAFAGLAYLAINFVLNRRWAFRATRGRALFQLARHAFVVGGGMAFGLPLLWLFVSRFHLPYAIGWTLAGGFVFLSWTFPMHRAFTYRGGEGGAVEPRLAA